LGSWQDCGTVMAMDSAHHQGAAALDGPLHGLLGEYVTWQMTRKIKDLSTGLQLKLD